MKKMIAWLAAIGMLANTGSWAIAEEKIITEEEIAALQAEVDALRMEISDAEALLKAMEKQYAYEHRDRDVIFAQTEYIILDGEEITLAPKVTPIKDTAPVETKLIWSTSDRHIARVDALGRVTGVNPGTAVITGTASDNPGIAAEVTVTVVKPVRKIEISDSIVTLSLSRKDGVLVGQTLQAEVKITPADAYDPSVTWTVEDESVVTVENGLLTAIGLGTSKISVVANDGSGERDVMRVYVVQGAESIDLSAAEANVLVGKTLKLNAKVMPENTDNKDVQWASSDPSIAQVGPSGLVQGIGPGKCVITATTADGTMLTAECVLEVIQPVKTITAETAVINLKKGETAAPVLTVQPENATDRTLSYISSNEQVAVVDENGVISPVDGGSCLVTAIANDGSGAKAVVTVNVEPDIPLEITGIEVHYSPAGVPSVMLEVRNCSFDTDITGFTFDLRCTDAYGNELKRNDEAELCWNEAAVLPGELWASETWGRSLSGCEWVWKTEAWLTSVTTAEGEIIPVPEDERIIAEWTKY